METSLFAPQQVIRRFIDVLDYLIYEIKLIDEEAHRKYTGESNKSILDNFRRFAADFPKVLVRVPLVPGVTAEEENLKAVGEFVRSCRTDIEIELLNYNWLSVSKYTRLDKPHFNAEARAFTDEEVARFYSWILPRGGHVARS
jgi:pyruvate formate lyase activating enzyme